MDLPTPLLTARVVAFVHAGVAAVVAMVCGYWVVVGLAAEHLDPSSWGGVAALLAFWAASFAAGTGLLAFLPALFVRHPAAQVVLLLAETVNAGTGVCALLLLRGTEQPVSYTGLAAAHLVLAATVVAAVATHLTLVRRGRRPRGPGRVAAARPW